MGLKRLLATAAAAALLTTGPLSAAAPAQEGPPAILTDVGTGLVDSTLLGIDVGDLVNLDLVHDDATSSIDPANGEAISSAAGNPLTLASTVLDRCPRAPSTPAPPTARTPTPSARTWTGPTPPCRSCWR